MSDPEIIGPGDIYMEPRRGMGPLAKIFAVTAIAIGVVALAGVVWFAYKQGIRSGAEDAAPVISASEDPIKRAPKDPGGLDIPDQDKLVFGRLAPGQIQEPVERLLPPPEEPAERPPAPVVETPVVETPVVETPVVETPVVETPTAETQPGEAPSAEAPVAEAPAEAPDVTVSAEPAPPAPAPPAPAATVAPPPPPPVVAANPPATPPAPAPEAAPKPAPKVATTPSSGGWRIQLAAVSSQDRAHTEWDRIKNRNTDLLGSLDLNVQSVKLDRGTFFRIQAGPLSDRAAASGLCGQLKSRNQDCLIVAP
ncbi:MAG: SPOR domain-containing protein [Alphaproteobacteria bacterium]